VSPVALFTALVAGCLLLVAAAGLATGRSSTRRRARWRGAVPWVVLAALAVGAGLALVTAAPPLVVGGVALYAAIAAAGTWRMATLDRTSPWMTPSRRLARLAFSGIGIVVLGIVLALMLVAVDLVARVGS
jgi:hypothetical protein